MDNNPCHNQPELTLERWSIYELPDGDRHFVGLAIETREGRVSSRIDQLDVKAMCGVTSSGRVYKLKGNPGHNSDAEYTWNQWRRYNKVIAFVDVSGEVWDGYEKSLAEE